MKDIIKDLEDGKYNTKLPYISRKESLDGFKAYQEDQRRLSLQFKVDCLEDTGLKDHPKADKIWDYVIDRHDSRREIYENLCELADLFLGK